MRSSSRARLASVCRSLPSASRRRTWRPAIPAASSSIARRSAGLAAITAAIFPWLTSEGLCAPVAASAKTSATSLARTSRPLTRYALPAPRSIRRVTCSSSPSSSTASSTTSVKSRGGRCAVPAKITSSIPPERIDFAEVSPMTRRIASSRFDLPQPLGPTTPVSPGSMRSSAGSTKLLKPASLSLRISIAEAGPMPSLPRPCRLQRGLDRSPVGALDPPAVEEERRRARDVELLRLGIGALDDLPGQLGVAQALHRLVAADSARGEEVDQAGHIGDRLESLRFGALYGLVERRPARLHIGHDRLEVGPGLVGERVEALGAAAARPHRDRQVDRGMGLVADFVAHDPGGDVFVERRR